jgi:hypothetical protein
LAKQKQGSGCPVFVLPSSTTTTGQAFRGKSDQNSKLLLSITTPGALQDFEAVRNADQAAFLAVLQVFSAVLVADLKADQADWIPALTLAVVVALYA